MSVHIHAPDGFTFRGVARCRRCRVRRRQVVTIYMYYGPIIRCCHCGAYVNDGELKPPRKLDANTARLAAQTWPTLPNGDEALAWVSRQLDRLSTPALPSPVAGVGDGTHEEGQ